LNDRSYKEARPVTRQQSLVRGRQAPLRALYTKEPGAAVIVKRAQTLAGREHDALHGVVSPDPAYGVAWPYGIDRAIGGLHDLPNPGELLCAALAACQDASVRMVADLLGIDLLDLAVEATGTLDVRGTLDLDRAARVGFERMTCDARVRVPAGTRQHLVELLRAHAERSCVNLDTLRQGVPVAASVRVETADS
jgi:uncharacterized OsmC-like protein